MTIQMMKGDNEKVYDIYKKKPAKFDTENLYDEEYEQHNIKDESEKTRHRKNKREQRQEEKDKRRAHMHDRKTKQVLGNCRHCLANSYLKEEQILSYGTHTYLALPHHSKNLQHVHTKAFEREIHHRSLHHRTT